MKVKINALVKGSELDCYDWIHEEGLCLVVKLDDIDEEHGICLYQAYNIDRDEWGTVASNQVVIVDDSVLDFPPIMKNCDVIVGSGNEVRAVMYQKSKYTDIL